MNMEEDVELPKKAYALLESKDVLHMQAMLMDEDVELRKGLPAHGHAGGTATTYANLHPRVRTMNSKLKSHVQPDYP